MITSLQPYTIILSVISPGIFRFNRWVIFLLGLGVLIGPVNGSTADPPPHMINDPIAGQPAFSVSDPVDAAQAWSMVDETIRRTTFLPDDLRWQDPEPPAPSMQPEMTGILADADRYLADLEEQRPFWGVYFRSDAAQDVDSGDTDLRYRLEWDLFKHGRYERKKELQKKRHRNELQTLQMLSDVKQHRVNEQLDGIAFLTQAVAHDRAGERAALLAQILRRRRVQLENGYITRDDFDTIRFKYRQAQLNQTLYDTGRHPALEASLHDLLNCVEFSELISLDQAQQAAMENAYALKIQENLAERAQYTRSWTDDLSLNLYVEQRNEFSDNSRSNVGLEVKLPIHWDTKREPLIDQEMRLYEKQAAVLSRRIKSNLSKLYDFFAFQKVRIQILMLDLEKITQRQAYEQMRAQRALEDLDYTPERALDQIRLEEIDLRYQVIQTRLKLYEILVKIGALTHAAHPRELLSANQPHCSRR